MAAAVRRLRLCVGSRRDGAGAGRARCGGRVRKFWIGVGLQAVCFSVGKSLSDLEGKEGEWAERGRNPPHRPSPPNNHLPPPSSVAPRQRPPTVRNGPHQGMSTILSALPLSPPAHRAVVVASKQPASPPEVRCLRLRPATSGFSCSSCLSPTGKAPRKQLATKAARKTATAVRRRARPTCAAHTC